MESKVTVVREAEATDSKWCRGLKLALTATIIYQHRYSPVFLFSLKATASIEVEDLIKQSVTQLGRKLAVEKEHDNCIILSSTSFERGKAMVCKTSGE